MAIEFHDKVGQTLTVLQLELEAIRSRLRKMGKTTLVRRISTLLLYVADEYVNTRRVASQACFGLSGERGFPAALRKMAVDFQQHTGIPCRIVGRNQLWLPVDKGVALLAITQEALTNVARHAGASEVSVRYHQEKTGELRLVVADNGRGIVRESGMDSLALGLFGMRQRAANSGGSAEVSSIRPHGTAVTVRLPLRAK